MSPHDDCSVVIYYFGIVGSNESTIYFIVCISSSLYFFSCLLMAVFNTLTPLLTIEKYLFFTEFYDLGYRTYTFQLLREKFLPSGYQKYFAFKLKVVIPAYSNFHVWSWYQDDYDTSPYTVFHCVQWYETPKP